MTIAEGFVMELAHEAGLTRKCLERVPADKFGWQPHTKSMNFGTLAGHIAEIPGWTAGIIQQPEWVIDGYQAPKPVTNADLLTAFDGGVAAALAELKKTSDETMMGTWQLKGGGQVIVEMPRVAVVRVWVLSHMIHHRGQITVYLRENDIAVPSIYGGSADEKE